MTESRQELPPEVQSRLVRLLDEPDDAFGRGVDELCATQPALAGAIRDEAASLLRAGRAGTVSSAAVLPPTDTEPLPTRIGPFRIVAGIGHGGMGTVYLAERADLKQRVALKVIKLGMDTKAVLARFDAERQALSRMEHAHIARVLDAGATDRGQPWFAMEHVKGEPITRYCDKHKLSIEDRLRLFQQVCSGVQHAHTKGVVHRDLTPNNILVTVQEGQAMAKIIDFGLAKATDRGLTDRTLFTEQGLILGTPEYMAPEQAGVGVLDVDTRADVYTLGVLLYELLVGALPFNRDELRAAGWDGICKTIQDKDPPRPSTKITEHGATQAIVTARRTDASALRKRMRGDLDWVVMKCLEKDRTRRYETATELSADIQRHLDHEPVLAHAPSFGYRLRKFARRYRGQLASAAMVLLAVLGALVTAVIFWLEAGSQATEAERQKGIAESQTRAAESARAGEAAMAREAAVNAATAQRNAEEAIARTREFDQLAGVVLYARAIEAEKQLYPAWPSRVAAMEQWLSGDAGLLLSLRGRIEQTVQSLRARALPATAEDRENDRTTHPRFGEWQKLAAKLAAMERAHAIRTRAQDLSLPSLTAEELSMTPAQLNEVARPRVERDESKRIWGEEPRALRLAQLAWEGAKDLPAAERAWFGDTLAWAWFANGKDAEAIAQSQAALALVVEDQRSPYAGYLEVLTAQVEGATGEAAARARAELRKVVGALDAEISALRSFRFADESQRFLHDTLTDLLGKVASLEGKERKNVDARLAWARQVPAWTRAHPKARVTWQAAREAIAEADGVVASELYRGQTIELRDQDVIGLVPIGMNPVTRLWEFYELRSAWDGTGDPAQIPIPRHVTDGERHGHIEVEPDTGIVFVLLPGGTFTMGAQNGDPQGPNYDRAATRHETPHQVTLAPFFLARHELTQGQWARLTGGEVPSLYYAGYVWGGKPVIPGDSQHILWSNPVENVDWLEAERCLWRHGMLLPTEAQWEYGCRAGTTTAWWTGSERESLRGAVNLADQTAKKGGATWSDLADWPDLEDGFIVHAPVGTLRPNGFGLHHMHGNVWEWCADWWGWYSLPGRVGDGLRPLAQGISARVFRGGSAGSAARSARSAARSRSGPSFRSELVGVRPARPLHLDAR